MDMPLLFILFSVWREAEIKAVCEGLNWKDTSIVGESVGKDVIPRLEFV